MEMPSRCRRFSRAYVRHLVTRHRAMVTEEDGTAVAFGAVVDARIAVQLADLFMWSTDPEAAKKSGKDGRALAIVAGACKAAPANGPAAGWVRRPRPDGVGVHQ